MGDYFSEIHFGLCLFQQFLLINLVVFLLYSLCKLSKADLKAHLYCNLYLHLKPAVFIDKILILHCFNHPSFSNVLQQKSVVMKVMYFTKVPEISTEGSTLINSIK